MTDYTFLGDLSLQRCRCLNGTGFLSLTF